MVDPVGEEGLDGLVEAGKMGGMVDPRHKKHVPETMPDTWHPYTDDGFVDGDMVDVGAMVLSRHPDYVAVMDAHRDQTVVGMRRTAQALCRRGWRMAKAGEERFVTGWASATLADKHEIDHAWLSPASAGVIARIASGEPLFEDLTDQRFKHLRPSRVLEWHREQMTDPDTRDPYLRFVGYSFALFGDQDMDVRRHLARTQPVEITRNERWRSILVAHATGTSCDLPEMPIPHEDGWDVAIDRLLTLEDCGNVAGPNLIGRLDAIAAHHEAIAWDVDGWADDDGFGEGDTVVVERILRDGGQDEIADLFGKQRTYGEDVALVHSALGMEAAALARSVRLYRFQKA